MLSTNKIISIVAMVILGLGSVVILPDLREWRLGKEPQTLHSSLPFDPVARAEQEVAISETMKLDTSRYERSTGTRYIDSLPISTIELEAAFRNRKPDRSEKVLPGEILLNLETKPARQELNRLLSTKYLTTRRQVMSFGLFVDQDDQESLPKLSKSQILRFLDTNWLSLQARFFLNPETNRWHLNHRPLAAQGSFLDAQRTQTYESSIERTIEDVRGLGVFLRKSDETKEVVIDKSVSTNEVPVVRRDSESVLDEATPPNVVDQPTIEKQTAAWLFRFDLQRAGASTSTSEYEFIFVHIVPSGRGQPNTDPWKIHMFCTTNQRQTLHYFSPELIEKTPGNVKETNLQASVHFTRYVSGGLAPSQSATRNIAINAVKKYAIADLAKSLDNQQFKGDWQSKVPEILDIIVEGL
jgi:hypothetical protein